MWLQNYQQCVILWRFSYIPSGTRMCWQGFTNGCCYDTEKKVKIINLCAQKNIGRQIKKFDKRIKKKLPKISNINNVNWKKIDLLFLSLPNGEAQKLVKKLYYKNPKLKFIDLSADFRLENEKIYHCETIEDYK